MIVSFLAAVLADQAPVYQSVPAQYRYAYEVKDDYSGVNFGANEERDGYVASGQYNVLLPDGRVQTVSYSVNGDGGYVADVQYSGTPKVAPAYHP